MKTTALTLLLSLAVFTKLFSQNVGINSTGSAPDASAMLDVSSTTKGFLMPRMTTAERDAITSPATGLTIFNLTAVAYQVNTGTPASPVWSTLGSGSGTVTSVSVTSANGVSGTVATPTTTPAISLTLGAITPSSVAATGTMTGSNLSGTNTGDISVGTANGLSLAGQALSLGLSSTSTSGALSSTDWNTFNNKASAANTWSLGGNGVASAQNIGTTSNFDFPFITNNTEKMRLMAGGNLGIGTAAPTAVLHLKAGSATANTAPLKFTTGALMTTAEAGAVEFLTDKFYGTITTGAARKEFTLNNIALTSGRVPFSTTNGRLTDLAAFTYVTNRLSPTYITLGAGAAAAGSAPLIFTSGVSLTTPVAGAMEFTTDNPTFTITTGAARKQFTLNDAALTSGRVPYTTTNGRLIDNASMTYASSRLSPTYLTLAAGTAAAGTAPLVMTAGVNLTTPLAGAMEFDGTHFYGTVGATRYQLDQQTGINYTGSLGITLSGTDFRNNLITGIAGGQTILGGTASGNALTLSSTSHVIKGKILFGSSAYDEQNNRLGIGNAAPTEALDVTGNLKFSGALMPNNLAGTVGQVLTSAGAGTVPTWAAIDTSNIASFSQKVQSLFSATAPVTYSSGLIGITQATTSTDGYLSSADWNTFNNKASSATTWNLGGNAVASMQSIGTTTNFELPFLTNNVERMRISKEGNLGIGAAVVDGSNAERLLVDGGSTSYNVISGKGDLNNYLQLNIKNKNSGTAASSDVVATNDAGDEENGINYIDMGVNSSGNTSTGVLGGANTTYLYSTGADFSIGNAISGNNLILFTGGTSSSNERMRIDGNGKVGIGTTAPSAMLHLKAGTTAANTAPLKFTSGSLMTTAEAGAVEFLTDKFYGTITTGAARKEFTLNESALTSGRVPFATTNGRLTDLATFTYATNRLSPTYITLGAGTATAGTAPLVFTSGTNLTTPLSGAMEFDGTHFYGTVGSTRYQLDQQTGTTYTGSLGITLSGNDFRNNLITGVAGGQTIIGGTASANALTLSSTSHIVKGKILFGTSAYDELNNRLGIGNNAPTQALDVTGNLKFSGALMPNNLAGTSGQFLTSAGAGTAPTWAAIDTSNIASFSQKVQSLFSATAPVTYSSGLIGITQATTSTDGYLSSADWNTFNNKASSATTWNLGGNAVASMQSIGTTTNFELPFLTNNVERMRISKEGNLGIGAAVVDGSNAERLLVDGGSTSYNVISGKGDLNNYLQLNIKNKNSGTAASSDVVATNDAGDEENGINYIDMGVNSSGNTSTGVLGGANTTYLYSTGADFSIGNAISGNNLILFTGGTSSSNERMRIDGNGKVGIGTTAPSAMLHLKAGTTAANTAPLKFTSGSLMTTAEAGAVEFLTDKFYGTITTGAARKEFTLNESALTSGRVPFATTNGRLTDLATFTYATNRLSPTYITLGAGTATAGTAPLVFTSGTNLTTPLSGAMEFDGTHFYGTVGSTRYQLDQQTYTGSNGITLSGTDFRNNLITGISGGQTVIGGTAASNSLTLSSTSHATKGKILFGTSAYDEVNNRLGIGTTTPNSTLDVEGSVAMAITNTTNDITLDATNYTVLLSSGSPTVTLPTASTSNVGRIYIIVNQTNAARTITSYHVFNGGSATTIAANSSITLQSYNSNWYRIQ